MVVVRSDFIQSLSALPHHPSSHLRPSHTLLHTPTFLQKTSHILQTQSCRLRINPVNSNESSHANECVERERADRSKEVHHGEKRQADQGIGAPIRRSRKSGAQGADREGEESAVGVRSVSIRSDWSACGTGGWNGMTGCSIGEKRTLIAATAHYPFPQHTRRRKSP
jgi:hypothetical protein